jgi:tellurite methyltransferase
MSTSDLDRWNAKYAQTAVPAGVAADEWLKDQIAGLSPGRALDLACGLGHNAIWLAQQGWQVDAVDISPVGLARAADLARAAGVTVQWIAADLDEFEPQPAAYDLVTVFRFLDRARLPSLIEQALRPGGFMIYETFTISHIARPESRMKNPAFALSPNELPTLFPGCETQSYSECSLPDRDFARLVARKRMYDGQVQSARAGESSPRSSENATNQPHDSPSGKPQSDNPRCERHDNDRRGLSRRD